MSNLTSNNEKPFVLRFTHGQEEQKEKDSRAVGKSELQAHCREP